MSSLIYLASPYSHPDELVVGSRFKAVCMAAARLMAEGHVIFSPIAHSHPIATYGTLPTNWEFWHKYDRALLEQCGKLWIYAIPGWATSRGLQAEVNIWNLELKRPNKPEYVHPTAEEMSILRSRSI